MKLCLQTTGVECGVQKKWFIASTLEGGKSPYGENVMATKIRSKGMRPAFVLAAFSLLAAGCETAAGTLNELQNSAKARGGDAVLIDPAKETVLAFGAGSSIAGTRVVIPAGALPADVTQAALVVEPAGNDFTNPDPNAVTAGPVVSIHIINLDTQARVKALTKAARVTLPLHAPASSAPLSTAWHAQTAEQPKAHDPATTASAQRIDDDEKVWRKLDEPTNDSATSTVAGDTVKFGSFAAVVSASDISANNLWYYAQDEYMVRCDNRNFDLLATPPQQLSLAYTIDGEGGHFVFELIQDYADNSEFPDEPKNHLSVNFDYPSTSVGLPAQPTDMVAPGDFLRADHPERAAIFLVGCNGPDFAGMWIFNFSEAKTRVFTLSNWETTTQSAATCGGRACTLYEGRVRFEVDYYVEDGTVPQSSFLPQIEDREDPGPALPYYWHYHAKLDVWIEGAKWHTVP